MHIKSKYEHDLKDAQKLAEVLKADAVAFELLTQDSNALYSKNSRKNKSQTMVSRSNAGDIQNRLNKCIADQDAEIELLRSELRKANSELSQKQSLIDCMSIEFQRYQVIKSFEARSGEDQTDDFHQHRLLRNRLAHSKNVVCI